MNPAARRAGAAPHLEEVAKVRVGDDLGVEGSRTLTGVREGPFVSDPRVDVNAPFHENAATERVGEPRAVGEDLGRAQSQPSTTRLDLIAREVPRVPRVHTRAATRWATDLAVLCRDEHKS